MLFFFGILCLFGVLVLVSLLVGVFVIGCMFIDVDYVCVEQFVNYKVILLVDYVVIKVKWFDDIYFVYVDYDVQGDCYLCMDSVIGYVELLFDQVKFVVVLGQLVGGKVFEVNKFGLQGILFIVDGCYQLIVYGKIYVCSVDVVCVKLLKGEVKGDEFGVLLLDKKSEVFICDWNLWVCDVVIGKEIQFIIDGVENFGYVIDNVGWKYIDNVIVEWLFDLIKIVIFQQDQCKIGDMYMVFIGVGYFKFEVWKYLLVGDKDVMMIECVIIDVLIKKVVWLDMLVD